MGQENKLPPFPTMLRKMWNGSEVQQWIDENIKPLFIAASPVAQDEREEYPEAIKTWPKRIWLQHGDEHEMPTYLDVCQSEAEVTWCRDHIEPADIPYIRADLAASAATPAQDKPAGSQDKQDAVDAAKGGAA